MTRPKPRYQPGDKIGERYQAYQALMGDISILMNSTSIDVEENNLFALKMFQIVNNQGGFYYVENR